jgi:hypothetical protein
VRALPHGFGRYFLSYKSGFNLQKNRCDFARTAEILQSYERCRRGTYVAQKNTDCSEGRFAMKRLLMVAILLAGLTQSGCAFLGGAATGALATGAGYEIQNRRQMDRLDEDYRNRRISREEYESRKRQIESGSIIY